MRKNKSEAIGTVLRQFLRQEGLETPLNEWRVIAAWPEVMGEAITRYTGNIFIKNQVMCIQIKSPALKANLMMSREQLVAKLNAYVGAQVIQSIKFI